MLEIKMNSLVCSNCGVIFALEETFLDNIVKSQRSIFCPNGHIAIGHVGNGNGNGKKPKKVFEKECTKCHLVKPLREFSMHRGNADGHQEWCKPCQNYYQKEYAKTHAKPQPSPAPLQW